ncbi:MAG: hypothetical protein HC896_13680 [Bacteroidales bacterium]|nr:hypothetical protein [Bacteroidales bacterium]
MRFIIFLTVSICFVNLKGLAQPNTPEEGSNKQKTTITVGGNEILSISETNGGVEILLDNNPLFSVEEIGNEVKIKLGDSEIFSVDGNENVNVAGNDMQMLLDNIGNTIDREMKKINESFERNDNVQVSAYADAISIVADEDDSVTISKTGDKTSIK